MVRTAARAGRIRESDARAGRGNGGAHAGHEKRGGNVGVPGLPWRPAATQVDRPGASSNVTRKHRPPTTSCHKTSTRGARPQPAGRRGRFHLAMYKTGNGETPHFPSRRLLVDDRTTPPGPAAARARSAESGSSPAIPIPRAGLEETPARPPVSPGSPSTARGDNPRQQKLRLPPFFRPRSAGSAPARAAVSRDRTSTAPSCWERHFFGAARDGIGRKKVFRRPQGLHRGRDALAELGTTSTGNSYQEMAGDERIPAATSTRSARPRELYRPRAIYSALGGRSQISARSAAFAFHGKLLFVVGSTRTGNVGAGLRDPRP